MSSDPITYGMLSAIGIQRASTQGIPTPLGTTGLQSKAPWVGARHLPKTQ